MLVLYGFMRRQCDCFLMVYFGWKWCVQIQLYVINDFVFVYKFVLKNSELNVKVFKSVRVISSNFKIEFFVNGQVFFFSFSLMFLNDFFFVIVGEFYSDGRIFKKEKRN